MSPSSLETAPPGAGLKRVVIEPLTRVEGHGKVTILLDEANRPAQVRLHIVEFRGFEKFVQGRPYWELPVMVQRLCGICPVSHHLAAAKATDMLVGVDELPPAAEKIRRLMHLGQTLQSHALHFFHLSSPDLLFGYDDPVPHRNVVGVIQEHPETALKGVKLRKYGQEVIRVTAGKRVHGTGAIPGGVNRALTTADRDYLREDIGQIVAWGQEAVALARDLCRADAARYADFGAIRSNMLGLVAPDGALELYHGRLRARDADGAIVFDGVDTLDYRDHIHEQVKSWSYMKFPFIAERGPADGWYRVGPLARVDNCDYIPTPLAEAARREFLADGAPVHGSLAYHWARMIELLHCAEAIAGLLDDPELLGTELRAQGSLRRRGVGVVEAPRGTLFHDYLIDADGLVEKANLIVSTTNNNQAMNEAIRNVAAQYFDGRELSEPLLNHIEVAIRAYDPCLSCATHALGKMPLEIELVSAAGEVVERVRRGSDGCTVCAP